MEIAVEDGAAGSRVSISSRSNKQNEQSKYLKAAPGERCGCSCGTGRVTAAQCRGGRSAQHCCYTKGRDRQVGWSGAGRLSPVVPHWYHLAHLF